MQAVATQTSLCSYIFNQSIISDAMYLDQGIQMTFHCWVDSSMKLKAGLGILQISMY